MPNESQFKAFHVHVYCTIEQMALCNQVRSKMLAELPEIDGAGPVRNKPVGPHPLPMFEAWFHAEFVGQVLNWVLLNRQGLSVLLHPLSGDDYQDHAMHAIWIGEKLPLDLSVL